MRSVESYQGRPFDGAQGRPFDGAQGRPFDGAQGRPFGGAQGRPWLIVAGDFCTHGGMDMANYGLARYLTTRGQGEIHLVAHDVSPDLAARSGVRVHRAWRPFGRHRLGEPLLEAMARRWAGRLAGDGVRVLANGGNVDAGDVSWVHYVHAAFEPDAGGAMHASSLGRKHRRYVRAERQALTRARLVLCNSRRTADDVVKLTGVPRDRAKVVYYGIESARFGEIDPAERAAARRALGIGGDRRLVLFAGALGDRRKNFDTLFEAWRTLCRRPEWDADLIVAGAGAELEAWRARAAAELPGGRLRMLGFRRDMPALIAASDLLVHPARYEAYGLAVHEAICRGLPALVSASAGVAERYPEDLDGLLLRDPESADEIVSRLAAWREDAGVRARVASFAARLRARTWDHMGQEIAEIVEGSAA